MTMVSRLSALVVVFTGCLLGQQGVSAADKKNGAALNLLMLGNGFSEAHHLEETLADMLSQRKAEISSAGADASVKADRFEHHSANLTDYLGNEVSKAIADEGWTWVTLQEQSEIPGFYPPDDNDAREDMWDRSLETIVQLNKEIQEAGATAVLFQTWGYFQQDPLNPDIYKDYQEMQDHITKGYELYYEEILKNDRRRSNVKIAPCGMAFSTIYHDLKTQGKDPLQDGSLFDALYEKNETPRKHPSAQGAYLCACVLFQTLTGLDVRQSTPPRSLDDDLDSLTTKLLQDAAYRTIQSYGTATPKKQKTYRPEKSSSSTRRSGWVVFKFLLAFFMGGGVLAGWIGWKWHGAAGSFREQYQQGNFYQLAPEAGDNMLMELIPSSPGTTTTTTTQESQWINPV